MHLSIVAPSPGPELFLFAAAWFKLVLRRDARRCPPLCLVAAGGKEMRA